MPLTLRRATPEDAASAAMVVNAVIAERQFTLFDRPFTTQDERAFIESLGPRQALFLAELDARPVGVQTVDLLVPFASSMRHVGTMGTWLIPEARGAGIGRRLTRQSVAFAREHEYEKFVIQVLVSNSRARRFYAALGFRDIGIARRHVRLDDVWHDEVYMEALLEEMTLDGPAPRV
jgi:phosphinothricin acetyltransferase